MAKREYTQHQKKIIENYYQNLDTIVLTRLQETVTEIYLADSEKKRERLWQRVEADLAKMKVPEPVKRHILEGRNVEVLARNLQEWLKAR